MYEGRKKRTGPPVFRGIRTLGFAGVLCLTANMAYAADLEQGKSIANQGVTGQAPCMTCHGAEGQGMAAAGFPFLAGLPAAYIEAQLGSFAASKRKQPVMEPIAKALNAEQIQAVAAWYASLKPVMDPVRAVQLQDSYPKGKPGAWLAERGDWSRGLPACVQCHGPGGVGVAPTFPALAGQSAMYIKNQLLAWQSGARPDDAHGLMGHLARKLTAEEIEAVSAYFGTDMVAAAAAVSTTSAVKTGGQP